MTFDFNMDLTEGSTGHPLSFYLDNLIREEWGRLVFSSYDGDSISFNNLSIASSEVFIADIDTTETYTVDDIKNHITRVQEELDLSFRVYQTFKGVRAILVTKLLNLHDYTEKVEAFSLLTRLESDDKYIQFVDEFYEYAARITPKANRTEDSVCTLLKFGSSITDKKIAVFVRLHDALCLDNEDWCREWRMLQ